MINIDISNYITEKFPATEAAEFAEKLKSISADLPPEKTWELITKILKPHYPFALHQNLYQTIYPDWEKIPAPAWFPTNKTNTQLALTMSELGFTDFPAFHRW